MVFCMASLHRTTFMVFNADEPFEIYFQGLYDKIPRGYGISTDLFCAWIKLLLKEEFNEIQTIIHWSIL